MPAKDLLFRGFARVLKPGGKLALCDPVLRRDPPLAEVLHRAKEFGLLRRVFGPARIQSLEDYASLAEESGLQVVLREDITEPTQPTFDRWRDNARSSRPQVEALVGATYLDLFARACGTFIALRQAGILGYGMLVASRIP